MIPQDKIGHLKAGAAAAVAGALLGAGAGHVLDLPLEALAATCAGVSSIIAGLTKEAADWLDNKTNPGMHGVDPLDALATSLPGVAAFVALVVTRL